MREREIDITPNTLQSPEEKVPNIRELTLSDTDKILDLERKSWIPELQTDEESVKQRFELGHKMFGIEENGKLLGKICFSYSNFSPDDRNQFPQTFQEFSHQPEVKDPNAAFVYNLDIEPESRNSRYAIDLIKTMENTVRQAGCEYVVIDGRPSSYNGSDSSYEQVKQKPKLKEAIDQYLEGGSFPTDKQLMEDSTLALYARLGGKFLWIMPNFVPEDKPAGGIRVIMSKELEQKPR